MYGLSRQGAGGYDYAREREVSTTSSAWTDAFWHTSQNS